ncbi:hypothetical protein ACFVRU_53575, partial [Streptomyces sp. NPDC057927]
MARIYNTFEFTGHLGLGKEPFKEKVFDSGWTKHTYQFVINEAKNNGVFVGLEGGLHKAKANVVHSFTKGIGGEKGAKIQIPWDDRLSNSTVDMIPDFKKTLIDLTEDKETLHDYYNTKREVYNLESKEEALTSDEEIKLGGLYNKAREQAPHRYEFVHTYDAIQFLQSNIEKYKGRKFKVKGNVEVSRWKDKVYRNYVPQSIELVSEEEPNGLYAEVDLHFTKDAIDQKDFREDKKVYIETYILSYDSQAKKDIFFPFNTVINAGKLDLENEQHMKRVDFLKRFFDGVKKDKVHHIPYKVSVFRGADTVEFTADQLTDSQKEMIEFGMAKLSDFAPKGGLLGETVEE